MSRALFLGSHSSLGRFRQSTLFTETTIPENIELGEQTICSSVAGLIAVLADAIANTIIAATCTGRIRAEAVEALRGDVSTLADRLPILRQVLDETLRLYPSAVQIIREAVANDDLGDNAIAKGDLMMIYPWLVHRHRKLWDDPDAFDHTRFAPAAKASLHRFQYIPFGAGPRICVGARFAITEALVILAHWLAARRFLMPVGLLPIPKGTVTLRPSGGMPLIIEPI